MMALKRLAAILLLLTLCCQAQAQLSRDRAGTWEAGFHLADLSAVALDGSVGSFLEIDGSTGYGFAGAYNFTNRLALMLDANWSSPNYRARFVPDGAGSPQILRTRLDVATLHLKGVVYLFDGDLTPFVEGGLGWTNIDSNIVDGPPFTNCWWDPWWGYICRSFYETYSETRTSYSAALGLRWDFSADLMLRGSVGVLKVDTGADTEDASLDTVRFDLAWRF
ncbi:MAG: porin family protein [Gammaproteobacteria bacterium]|nr:porin family protein [Gammaproteobacteria bacterium]